MECACGCSAFTDIGTAFTDERFTRFQQLCRISMAGRHKHLLCPLTQEFIGFVPSKAVSRII